MQYQRLSQYDVVESETQLHMQEHNRSAYCIYATASEFFEDCRAVNTMSADFHCSRYII